MENSLSPCVKMSFFLRCTCLFLLMAVLGLCCGTRAFSSCRVGATLGCGASASHCGSFSQAEHGLWCEDVSSCGSQAVECKLHICGAWASLLCIMWDPSGGTEAVSPVLADGFLIAGPPRKPFIFLNDNLIWYRIIGQQFYFILAQFLLLRCQFSA